MIRKKLARSIHLALALACLCCSSQVRAQFVADASDAFGNSSFISTAPNDGGYVPMWTNDGSATHQYPDQTAGGTYTTNNFRMRTPDDGGSYTFDGQLILNNTNARDGGLMYKGTGDTGILTIADLVLDGGRIAHQNGVGDIFQLMGGITVQAASTLDAKQGPVLISSTITGAADLSIVQTDVAGSAARTVSILGDATGYSGNIDVIGHFTVGDTGAMTFDIGASGTNNVITGTGVAVFDGMFNFDLTGASSNPGDSWTITGVANQTYGETFSVGGGFAQSGSFWSDGTYLFDPSSGVLSVAMPPAEWNTDLDDQTFSTGANWTGGAAPGAGGDALFGTIITGNRTVVLDANASLNSVAFANTGDGDYYLAPQTAETLTLTGEGRLTSNAGRHWVQLEVQGGAIQKTGGGELIFDHANSFTGNLTVADGRLSVTENNAIPSGTKIELTAATAELNFGGDNGFFVDNGSIGGGFVGGVIDGIISGAGDVLLGTGAQATFTAANTYAGTTDVQGTDTRLSLTGSGTLGAADGTAATQTRIGGLSQVVLSGVAVGNEVLKLDERADAGTPAHLSSSGTSSWAGNINADIPGEGSHYKIEATSGTLTLSGTLSAWDETAPNDRFYVFGGDGDINITGRITDAAVDDDGVIVDAGDGANVHVIKRGEGTLTVGTNGDDDYWFGNTTVEGGTLVLTANAGSNNELFSSVTTVRAGATLDISSFTAGYDVGIGDELAGGGTFNVGATTLGLFDDNSVTPGDSVGTLNVTGNVVLSADVGGGSLNYELGDTTSIGGTENDLIAITGSLTTAGTPSMALNITPVENSLATGTYRLISHTGGATNFSSVSPTVVNSQGTTLTVRQVLTVNGSTTGQVNLNVTGSARNLTWNGTGGSSTWNVASSSNWLSGATGSDFRDLDAVTFGDGAAQKDVVIDTAVTPASTTFSSISTYTFTGEGGIEGNGPVNVNSGTVRLQNTGNNYVGTTTIASGARLEIGDASTGDIVVNGTLSVGQASLPTVTGFVYLDATDGVDGNTTEADGSTFTPTANPDWQIRTVFGNGGQIYQGGSDTPNPNEAAVLRTTITGLAPGSSHEVFVNYWDATGSSWRILAGASEGSLTLFDSPDDAVAGATDGVDPSTLNYGAAPLTAEGNRLLWGASLGTLVANGNGEIAVFVDDSGTADGDDRTWYDGVSYSSEVQVGETLTINGDLTLNNLATLELNLAASVFDSLLISGEATLDGTLAIDFSGDSPANGAQFTILTAAGGIQTPLEVLDFGGGLPENFTASYDEAMTQLILTFDAGLPGDFNGDGFVDIADFTVWRDNLGAAEDGMVLNGNGDGGAVGVSDYSLWRSNFGAIATAASSLANQSVAPEPTAACLFVGLIGFGPFVRYRPKP